MCSGIESEVTPHSLPLISSPFSRKKLANFPGFDGFCTNWLSSDAVSYGCLNEEAALIHANFIFNDCNAFSDFFSLHSEYAIAKS